MNRKARRQRFAPRLVVMTKEPLAGRVKTRLAHDIGTIPATRFFRTNLALTLQRVATGTRWQTILAVAPQAAISSRAFSASPARMTQGAGDLGQRLQGVFAAAPPGPVVVIGGDIPGIVARDIVQAFMALRGADAVFGPASDGGYWLVGLAPRARHLRIFQNVRWSSTFALADTRANLTGRRVREVATKHDVDNGADLSRLSGLCGRLVCGASESNTGETKPAA